MKTPVIDQEWAERTSAPNLPIKQTDTVFESFFERTSDAVWLFDPQAGVFLDCNQAAVDLIGAKSKAELLQTKPEDLSPPYQPGGMSSRDRSAEVTALIEKYQGYRFEWLMRHMDGHEVPLEVSCTPITMEGRRVNVVISRNITERKKAEQETLELISRSNGGWPTGRRR